MKTKAGFGKVDITPRVGVQLCGFGPYLNRHSTRVLEPLYARAMAVELDGARWVIVSGDIAGFNTALTRQIREIVRQATMFGSVPFTESFEDEVLAAALKIARKI